MKTRFTPLVTLKKNVMQKSEANVQQANESLNNAKKELELSYDLLSNIQEPTSGNISQMLSTRMLISAQRDIIKHNHDWIQYAQNSLKTAKEQLKIDTIEHEKMKYLEIEEIKKIIKAQKEKESKDLDEVALMTYKKGKK